MDRLELTEDGHIVCGKDDEGYPIIVGSVIWNDVARRKSHRMQVVPFQGFTTMGKTHAFSIIHAAIAAWNARAGVDAGEAERLVECEEGEGE